MKLLAFLIALCLVAGVAYAEDDTHVLILRDQDGEAVAYTAGPDDPMVVEINHFIFRIWNWYQKTKTWINDPEWPWDEEQIGGGGGGGGGGGAG